MGSFVDQAFGQQAKKKEAKRRVAILDGNINSYSRLMNGPEQMKILWDYNNLSAALGKYNKEKDENAAASAKDKEKEEADNVAKKAAKEASEKKMKAKLMPAMEDDIRKGLEHVLTCTNPRLRKLVCYYFDLNVPNLFKKKQSELIDLLHPLLILMGCDILGVERVA